MRPSKFRPIQRFFLFLTVFVSALIAQDTPSQEHMAQGEMMKMPEQCKAIMAGMKERMAPMKKMDTRLQEKVEAMNKTEGQAKVDAMAAVINEMVEQRSEMHDKMMSMGREGMQHMMKHMGEGKGMIDCPMLAEPAEPGSEQ